MVNFEFHNPTKIIFGKNTISQIGKEISQHGFKNILLLAGHGSIKKNGVYETVIKSLQENNITVTEVWGIQSNPILSKVNEAIEIAKTKNVDAILAVGGGSVIDSAKSISAGYYLDNIWDAYESKVEIKQALPLFTILTISAAGSEMNKGAVLTNEKEQKKWSLVHPLLFPKLSIIDPSNQTSLPWNQTANGAIDALAHIMEFYFLGKQEETTLALNESLMRTIVKTTDKLKIDPTSYDQRANLAWAATLALNGISGSMLYGDWSSHQIEHAISALYPKVAHGTGLAIVFPAWITYVHQSNSEIFQRWAKNVWDSETVEDAVKKMKAKFTEWNVPISLSQLNIKEEELLKLSEIAFRKGTLGTLKELSQEDILKILKLAL